MNPRFRRLWLATAVSNLGDGLRLTALPLLATRLTRDPRLIAGVAVADRIPWVLLILPGGALADRVDRLRLRIGLDMTRAVIVGLLAVLAATGHASIVVVTAAAALLSGAEAIVDSSSMALVPSLVDEADLERAGSRLNATEMIANAFLGPPIGAALFGLLIWLPFAGDAASFVTAALVLMGMTPPAAPGSLRDAPAQSRSMRGQIAEGLRWLWAHRTLRRLALVSFGLGFASFISGAVVVIFAKRSLGLTDAQFGLVFLPTTLGALGGASLASVLGKRFGMRTVLSVTTVLTGLAVLGTAAARSVWLVAVLWAVASGSTSIWNILTIAYRQREIPDRLLGRVGASYRLVVYGGMPLGALVGGVLTDAFGVRTAIAASGWLLVALGALAAAALPRTGNGTAVSDDIRLS